MTAVVPGVSLVLFQGESRTVAVEVRVTAVVPAVMPGVSVAVWQLQWD